MRIKVNYDKIAQNYDQRYLKNPHQGVLNTLRRILSEENPQKVLEVGCGTSHWLKALGSIDGVKLFGIDSSFEMLRTVGQSPGINLCQGQAEHLPINCETINLVFIINAFHHFKGKIEFIKEVYRFLSKDGTIAIIGMDPRDDRNKWYIYKYFEGTYEHDLIRFPSWFQIKNWLMKNGFEDIHFQDVEIIKDPKFGKNVLKDPFLKKSGSSQLSLLSDAEYDAGLKKLKVSLENNSSHENKYENEIVLSMMMGKKPEKV